MTIIMLLAGITVLILIHELGHFLTAKWCKVRVEEFGIGFPPRLWSRKKGETRVSVNLLPLGGFVRLYGERRGEEAVDPLRSFASQNAWRRALIIFAGVCMNFLFGWLLISFLLLAGSPGEAVITSVAPNSPAAAAELAPGDRVSGFSAADEFVSYVTGHRGEEISFEVRRGRGEAERTLAVRAVPRLAPPPGEGALGVTVADSGIPRVPFPLNFWEGLKTAGAILWFIARSLYQIAVQLMSAGRLAEGVVGPVGIAGIAGQAADVGIVYFLELLAMISLNLVVLNILPIPALDGGRLLFILIEKMKGSPVKARREELSHAVGFAILLLLMVALTARDITRLF